MKPIHLYKFQNFYGGGNMGTIGGDTKVVVDGDAD